MCVSGFQCRRRTALCGRRPAVHFIPALFTDSFRSLLSPLRFCMIATTNQCRKQHVIDRRRRIDQSRLGRRLKTMARYGC